MHGCTLRGYVDCSMSLFDIKLLSSLVTAAFKFMERDCRFFCTLKYSKIREHILSGNRSIFMKYENINKQVYFKKHKV